MKFVFTPQPADKEHGFRGDAKVTPNLTLPLTSPVDLGESPAAQSLTFCMYKMRRMEYSCTEQVRWLSEMMPVKYFAQQLVYSEDQFMDINIVVDTDICIFQRMCLVATYIHLLGIC